MKTTGKMTKIFALVLCVAMLVLFAASCGASNTDVYTYTDTETGKKYTLTEAEFSFLMKYRKYEIFSSYASNNYGYMNSSWDNAEFWNTDSGENKTLDSVATESVKETAKSVVIERFLMEKYGLSLENDADMKKEMEEAAKAVKDAAKKLGGSGAFKRYWGYTPDELINYNKMVLASEMVSDYLYNDETGTSKLTDEQLDKYYEDNYKQYFIILINTEQNIKTNAEGKKLVSVTDAKGEKTSITLEQALDKKYLEDNKYTLSYTFEYENITGEDKENKINEKKLLADKILQQLKDGAKFEELALQYSEEFLTHMYKNGYIVSGDLISDETAKKEIDKLELEEGKDMTGVVSVSSGKYLYIVKRVPLTEKAYEQANEGAADTTYADIFKNFRTTVKSHTYSEFLKTHTGSIVANENILGKYNMKDTFLSKEIYYTYG